MRTVGNYGEAYIMIRDGGRENKIIVVRRQEVGGERERVWGRTFLKESSSLTRELYKPKQDRNES